MDRNKAFSRVLKKWKIAFVIAIIVYIVVFIWASNYEAQQEKKGQELEEPLELFSVTGSPRITTGANVYTVNITNNQDYTIEELTIRFEKISPNQIDDFSNIYEGTLTAGSIISYSNQVYPGAVSLDLDLTGQSLVTGMTDLNLYLRRDGSTSSWESTTVNSNDESIHLTENDLNQAGFGNYIVEIRHENGLRDVDFELSYSITYGTPQITKSTTAPIEPGQGREFQFNLNLDQSDVSELECMITGSVTLLDGLELNIEIILDSSWNVIRFSTPIPEEEVDEVPWGPVDLTGTTGVVLYSLTILTGFMFYLRIKFHEDFSLKKTGWVHCFLSLMATVVVGAHMSTALLKVWNWPWGSAGMNFAVSSYLLLITFTIFSLFDVEFIKILGREKWRWVHLLITFGLLLLIILHFGYMGDHLGFLK
jgi:hypothetical protein